jgi:hypothetical protein
MASYEHEFDRDKTEQGGRVAIDIAMENWGFKEDRIGEVCRRAAYAAELAELFRR